MGGLGRTRVGEKMPERKAKRWGLEMVLGIKINNEGFILEENMAAQS